MEHWVEVNLFGNERVQDRILLSVLLPHVEAVRRKGALITWHFFREPEIRFRMRLKSETAKDGETRSITALANSLQRRRLISKWHFGNHGERGQVYVGEEDRYGKMGWAIAQDYFNSGSEIALRLLALKKRRKLENPLWAKGLGNPWEGGVNNPCKKREFNPLVYHWSRYVHLFTNQLGFGLDDEAKLCAKQASRYRRISKQLGMR